MSGYFEFFFFFSLLENLPQFKKKYISHHWRKTHDHIFVFLFQIVRTFVELKSTHPRIVRALKDRERADGQLGR